MRTNKFKLIGLLVCFAAAAMMMSCTKDSKTIVGTWGCIHSYNHRWGNASYWDTYDPYDYVETDSYRGEVVTFKDDGTYTSSDDDFEFNYDGYWMIDGNILLINRYDTFNIQTLNNNTLKLHYSDDVFSGSAEYYTYPFESHRELTIEFKRQ